MEMYSFFWSFVSVKSCLEVIRLVNFAACVSYFGHLKPSFSYLVIFTKASSSFRRSNAFYFVKSDTIFSDSSFLLFGNFWPSNWLKFSLALNSYRSSCSHFSCSSAIASSLSSRFSSGAPTQFDINAAILASFCSSSISLHLTSFLVFVKSR